MKKSALLLTLLVSAQVCAAPSSSKGVWSQRGNASEGYSYSIISKGNIFSIRCHPNKPASIDADILSFGRFGSQPYQSDFVFEVNDKIFVGHHVLKEKKSFEALWGELKNAKTLNVYEHGKGSRMVSLPTDGLSEILPTLGSKGFPCQSQAAYDAAVLANDLANIEPLKNGDIQISKRLNPYYGSQSWNKYLIDITSRSDRMVITEMQINRGRCALSPKAKPPFRMGYGSKITLPVEPASCNPLEITITTLGGEQTFSFKQ